MAIKLPVFILAGGKSSRFGSDKARALVNGEPLLSSIAKRLNAHADPLRVIADVAGKYDDLGVTTLADEVAGLGPMGGLKTALNANERGGDWLLLVSCDLIALKPAWLKTLWKHRARNAKAVAFKRDRWEPLFALYHCSIGENVESAIADGELSMQKLLEWCGAAEVPLPQDWPEQAQVNSREELNRFLKNHAGQSGRGTARMASKKNSGKAAAKLPGTYKEFIARFPALGKAHEQVAKSVESAGPLNAKMCALIKIGICVGAGLESATRSHVRRAMQHGASEKEIEQAIVLAMNTVGFPKTVAAWSWARQQFERGV